MQTVDSLIEHASEIEKKLGYKFQDKQLLALAFVHRSYVNENREVTDRHNERLEFLGDSVLGLLIADYLYRYLPSTPEGELSHLRARLVEAQSCVRYVQELDVEPYILLGKGERRNDGRGRDSILSDLFEAIIGAIFLDGGLSEAKKFLFRNFNDVFESILREPVRNWKAELQDYAQKVHRRAPSYRVVREEGPDHSKTFFVAVDIDGEEMGRGEGPSKKEAQQEAAKNACSSLDATGGP